MDANTRKTYTEMVAYAKTLHPNAEVSLALDSDSWQITILTDFEESFEADADWADTPAGKAFATPEAEYGNVLNRWADHNGFRDAPIAIAAQGYNLEEEAFAFKMARFDEELAAAGTTFDELIGSSKAENQITFSRISKLVEADCQKRFAARRRALNGYGF